MYECDHFCFKALLIFGAEYGSVNSGGETAWTLILKTHQSKLLNNLDKVNYAAAVFLILNMDQYGQINKKTFMLI